MSDYIQELVDTDPELYQNIRDHVAWVTGIPTVTR